MCAIFLKISKKWMEIKQTVTQKAKVWHYIILLLIPILVVLGIYKYLAYQNLPSENDIHPTDAEIIERAVSILKEDNFMDKKILNINRLVRAEWSSSALGCECMHIVLLNNIGELEDSTKFEYINLEFETPPYDAYGRYGTKTHIVEKFIEQINKKFLKRIPLMNFIQKDLIVTLEFADSDKVIFDAYYNDIKESLSFWYHKFGINTDSNVTEYLFQNKSDLKITTYISDGTRSSKEISTIINTHGIFLTNMYNEHLKNSKNMLSEVVILSFTIAGNGKVIDINSMISNSSIDEFYNAVEDYVATWKWKPIKNGNTTVAIKFEFSK